MYVSGILRIIMQCYVIVKCFKVTELESENS